MKQENSDGLARVIEEKNKLESIMSDLLRDEGPGVKQGGVWRTYLEQYGSIALSLDLFREHGHEVPPLLFDL